VIILVLVWRKSIHFWRRLWAGNYIFTFSFRNLDVWPLTSNLLH